MSEKSSLPKLKKDYTELERKHKIPSFEIMNEEFNIEKIADAETDLLAREIRKYIVDKYFNYMRVIETILQPSNAPIFVYMISKPLTEKERKKLSDVYRKLTSVYLEVLEIDLEYSEEKEIAFIKKAHKEWLSIKKELIELMKFIKENVGKNSSLNFKGYFG